MRILLVHKFLRPGGGAEQVALSQRRWLRAAGHEVVLFGMQHVDNVPSPHAGHWVPPIDYARPTPRQLVGLIWSREAAVRLSRLVAETQPEVALLHNIYHQLSPSILPVLRRAGLRIVLVVHDYKLICPNYRLYTQGARCTRCVGSHAWHAVRFLCLKDSRAASALAAIETTAHRRLRAYRHIETLIAPSRFVRRMLIRGGWPAQRIVTLPHALDLPPPPETRSSGRGEAFLFAGRLVPEKGVELLLEAARRLPHTRFWVAGCGDLEQTLRAKAPPNVNLLGQLTARQLAARRRRAVGEIVPSLWPEVFGLSALEAMAEGLPVVASDVGGLGEIISSEETGLLVPPGDVPALTAALDRLWADPALAIALGSAARLHVAANHGRAAYLERLMSVLRGDKLGARQPVEL